MRKIVFGLMASMLCMSIATTYASANPTAANPESLNIYSARNEALIKPLLDQFASQHNVTINLVTGKADALLARAKSEGQFSPVDIIITTDVGRLARAKSQGLTQPITATLPAFATLQDPQQHWVALTTRNRPIIINPSNIAEGEITRYEDLIKPEYKGRVCVRSSTNIYNQSMVAAMLMQQGEAATLAWAKGLVNNFARRPKGGDRDQIKAIVAGVCDIALANTYYLAAMRNADADSVAIANQVKVVWPNQSDRGVHLNISGIAVAKYAKNTKMANQLITFMLGREAQDWYAKTNHEYPVDPAIEWSSTLQAMGTFKAESVELNEVGELNAKALQIMDKAGWQ
ncbi:MAG: extracellular solute-binding protein [Glaciecola sp.]|nr:extracellular solute-binding protein [Glaciecola sp.]